MAKFSECGVINMPLLEIWAPVAFNYGHQRFSTSLFPIICEFYFKGLIIQSVYNSILIMHNPYNSIL